MPSIIRSCSTGFYVFHDASMYYIHVYISKVVTSYPLYSILRLNYITKYAGCHKSVCERERENVEWFLFVVTSLDLDRMHTVVLSQTPPLPTPTGRKALCTNHAIF